MIMSVLLLLIFFNVKGTHLVLSGNIKPNEWIVGHTFNFPIPINYNYIIIPIGKCNYSF